MPESASRGGGGSGPGGGVCSGGVSGPGGSGPRGCLLRGVCLVWSQHALRQNPPPLWTESQMPVKTLPWPNFVAAGNDVELNLDPLRRCDHQNLFY